ncbi:Cof-type HAD-IIB family hydrolase [Streptococcus zalophi]|uniref:HAD family hydrolase n=1 Tax=Streptococcus zalophi TaxID=640031 RepID=A0A934UD46_9STRE|nr:Cof-type HAD-IIB family hydrolase [Streptococcus zalophi]MBJ8349411.1 HAD family hydrolase [Streptococcus zalophi]MCR8967394.1 Cof-type HAD-IIB family hydrolase [Streptococcus zalophi]
MSVKLIACDMDGTLLDNKGSYDRSRFEKMLRDLKERDIKFLVATGNNMERLSLMFDGLVDDLSFVAENGSHLLENGKTFIRKGISDNLVYDFLDFYHDKLVDYRVMISTASTSYVLKGTHFDFSKSAIEKEQLETFLSRIKTIKSFSELPKEPFLKINMAIPVDQEDEIITSFNHNFTGSLTAVTSGYGAVDVTPTGIHKAWGLKHFMSNWNIKEDELMAFGDAHNDIEMLKLAKYSYAMANAPQDVKNSARFLAPSNRDNGVFKIIEKQVLGR